MSKDQRPKHYTLPSAESRLAALRKESDADPFSRQARKGFESLRSPERAQQVLQGLDRQLQSHFQAAPRRARLHLSRLIPLGIAASLALAVIAYWAIAPQSGQLAYSAFDPLPAVGADAVVRGEAEPAVDLKAKALILYETGAYEQALKAFAQIERQNDPFPELPLYQGISYLGLKQPKQAVRYLKKAFQAVPADSSLARAGRWYLALSYLADDQTDQAEILLDGLAGSPGDYNRQARELLNELSSKTSR